MKKITLLALTMLFVTFISNAQLKFGVKAGANMSSFTTESDLINFVKGSNSYQFGVVFQAKVLDFAIQPEVLYSVKGGKFNNSRLSSLLTDTEFESQNIEIPVNVQYGFDAGLARVFVQGGPYVSFLTGGSINGSTGDFKNEKESFNAMDFGLGVWAGAELLGVQLAIRCDWGLTNIGEEKRVLGYNVNPFNELKNTNVSVSLAYLF